MAFRTCCLRVFGWRHREFPLHWEMLECIAKKELELAQLVEGEYFSAACQGGNIRSDLRTKLPNQLVKDVRESSEIVI